MPVRFWGEDSGVKRENLLLLLLLLLLESIQLENLQFRRRVDDAMLSEPLEGRATNEGSEVVVRVVHGGVFVFDRKSQFCILPVLSLVWKLHHEAITLFSLSDG
jgi:hypothetical protein